MENVNGKNGTQICYQWLEKCDTFPTNSFKKKRNQIYQIPLFPMPKYWDLYSCVGHVHMFQSKWKRYLEVYI